MTSLSLAPTITEEGGGVVLQMEAHTLNAIAQHRGPLSLHEMSCTQLARGLGVGTGLHVSGNNAGFQNRVSLMVTER